MSAAAALGLHVGLGWGLGWTRQGEETVAAAPGATETLVWLDGEGMPAPAAAAPAAVNPVSREPVAREPVARARSPRTKAPPMRAPAAPESTPAPQPLFSSGDDALGDLGAATALSTAFSTAFSAGGARHGQLQPRPLAHQSSRRSAPAHLLATRDPCADLFPYAARSDSGTVAVALDVATNGQPRESHIVEEAPHGQGFALAAHHCVQRLRFAPALDAEGHAVASRSVVRLRFARRAAL